MGKYTYSFCDHCGQRWLYSKMRMQWNGIFACPECFDTQHVLIRPGAKEVHAGWRGTGFGAGAGGVIGVFITDPTQFSFVDLQEVLANSEQISNSVEILGMTTQSIISIVDGQYSIDGGGFTGVAGTIGISSSVRVRHTSADELGTVNTILTIGVISDTFSTTSALFQNETILNPDGSVDLSVGQTAVYNDDGSVNLTVG